MALGSTISVDSLQEWRSNLKRIEKHDPRLGALVATHSKVWAVGQVLDVTLEQPEMKGSSKDQRG